MIINSSEEILRLPVNNNGWRTTTLNNSIRVAGDVLILGAEVNLEGIADIGFGVSIGNNVALGDCVRIGNGTYIEDGCRIGVGVCLGRLCRIGANVHIAAHTMLGDYVTVPPDLDVAPSMAIRRSDGFEFFRVKDRVLAGCRHFTLPEAIEHWSSSRGWTSRLGAETFQILRVLFTPEEWAKAENTDVRCHDARHEADGPRRANYGEAGGTMSIKALEERVIRGLIQHLAERGWKLSGCSDGEENFEKPTVDEAVATVFSVDESWLYFKSKEVNRRHWVYLVCGNGVDVISDNSVRSSDSFDRCMEAFDPEVFE